MRGTIRRARGACLAALWLMPLTAVQAAPPKPNVVLILIDDKYNYGPIADAWEAERRQNFADIRRFIGRSQIAVNRGELWRIHAN